MKFEFFESLTPTEAELFLADYLFGERQAFQFWRGDAEGSGVTADLTLESIESVFAWVAAQLRVSPRPADENSPEWIRRTSSYEERLFTFDDTSRVWIIRASFYYGETFVRNFAALSWRVGNATPP